MSTPIAPYTPAVRAGDWLAVSGQLGQVDGALVEGGFEPQLRQLLVNLEALLAEHGATPSDVVKCTVFLVGDMSNFAALNELYGAFFAAPRPARSCIAVAALPLGALVEIEAWAHVGFAG